MARRKRAVGNAEVAKALRELGLHFEMEGRPFKPRAFEKAALAVESLDRPLSEIAEAEGEAGIDAIPSIGHGIAERILEMLETGRMRDLEEHRRRTPIDVLALTAIEGLGPRKAKALYEALGIRDVRALETACRKGRVREVPGFGERTERRILEAIAFLSASGGRRPLGEALPLARAIAERLLGLPGVVHADVAGSIRRRRETIGDLDFLVAARQPARVARAFAEFEEVAHVYACGETKAMVRLAGGLDADLRAVAAESYGAALLYFTGSKAHNVALRRVAQQKGMKLNEYGLFRGRRRIAGASEDEVYEALGLTPVPPELREDRGEVEAALAGKLPELIGYGELRGDLQIQTDWSDGDSSLEEMVEAARQRGLEYIAITDHTRDLAVAGGQDEARILEQAAAVRRLDRKLRGFRVLTGAEVNIREDGSLDVGDETLSGLDVVGAAIHGSFRQSRAATTKRLVRALENPHVDILFHPTARALGHRAPVDVDIDALVAAAHRTGTVLEIDGMPDRLDLPDEAVRKAVEAGVPLAIDSDAHHVSHLAYADDFGVAVARRGWARRADVVNAWPVTRCLARLKGGRRRSRRR